MELDVGITGAGSDAGQESSSVSTGAGSAPGTPRVLAALATVRLRPAGLGGTNLIAPELSGGTSRRADRAGPSPPGRQRCRPSAWSGDAAEAPASAVRRAVNP